MSQSTIAWSLVVCVVVFWLAAPSAQAGDACVRQGHDLCEKTGLLRYKNFTTLNTTELDRVCTRKAYFTDCLQRHLDNCEAFDQMEMRKYIAKYNYICQDKRAFRKHRQCITSVSQNNINCPNPELFSKGDKLGGLDQEQINRTRSCWEQVMRGACGGAAASWYDRYLDVIHDVVTDHYLIAMLGDGMCYDDATEECYPDVRRRFNEIQMSASQVDSYCTQESNVTVCFEGRMSGCESYDKMLIERDVEHMKYICNDTAAFLQHRGCLGGFILRSDVNCTLLDVPEFGGQITKEITEEEVNVTKACWMSAVNKWCPAAADWYEGYQDIGYELALKYSTGGMLMASSITLLVVLVLGKLVV